MLHCRLVEVSYLNNKANFIKICSNFKNIFQALPEICWNCWGKTNLFYRIQFSFKNLPILILYCYFFFWRDAMVDSRGAKPPYQSPPIILRKWNITYHRKKKRCPDQWRHSSFSPRLGQTFHNVPIDKKKKKKFPKCQHNVGCISVLSQTPVLVLIVFLRLLMLLAS